MSWFITYYKRHQLRIPGRSVLDPSQQVTGPGCLVPRSVIVYAIISRELDVVHHYYEPRVPNLLAYRYLLNSSNNDLEAIGLPSPCRTILQKTWLVRGTVRTISFKRDELSREIIGSRFSSCYTSRANVSRLGTRLTVGSRWMVVDATPG